MRVLERPIRQPAGHRCLAGLPNVKVSIEMLSFPFKLY